MLTARLTWELPYSTVFPGTCHQANPDFYLRQFTHVCTISFLFQRLTDDDCTFKTSKDTDAMQSSTFSSYLYFIRFLALTLRGFKRQRTARTYHDVSPGKWLGLIIVFRLMIIEFRKKCRLFNHARDGFRSRYNHVHRCSDRSFRSCPNHIQYHCDLGDTP